MDLVDIHPLRYVFENQTRKTTTSVIHAYTRNQTGSRGIRRRRNKSGRNVGENRLAYVFRDGRWKNQKDSF